MDIGWLIGGGIVWLIVWLLVGSYVAKEKGRSEEEGALFGLLLGPIGIIIVALLPSKR